MAERAPRLSTCIDMYGAENLLEAVAFARAQGFSFVSTNAIFEEDKDGVRGRGPQEIPSGTYQDGIQSRVTPDLDVDVEDEELRTKNQLLLKREIEYATFLGIQVLQIDLTRKHRNLAATLQNCLQQLESSHSVPVVWMIVSLCGPPEDEFETFRRWQSFREAFEACPKIWVALIIPPNLPDNLDEILDLWMGEQVAALYISTKQFIMNANNFPVLSKPFQNVVRKLMGLHPVIAFTDVSVDDTALKPKFFADYMNHMFAQRIHVGPLQEEFTCGFHDNLQIPLQPLADHLESVTYEIFEKDPVKYIKYREAFLEAFSDLRSMVEERKSPLVVMVVGAGRGPLVSLCLRCSTEADVPLKLYAVEKNPSAVNVLRISNRDIWQGQVTVVDSDMRTYTPENGELADILVSELLGSWGDNELSPECLDGAQRLLKPSGISIPSSYTSYVNPIQCAMMHRQAKDLRDDHKPQGHQLSTPYVVYFRHVNHLAEPKKLFEFKHPNRDLKGKSQSNAHNERLLDLSWESKTSCIFHGFAGYFDCVLYKNIGISTHPKTHTHSMNSWFPVFIPIQQPQSVKKGERISVTFWRKVCSAKVWYQWMVSEPQASIVHNVGGRSSSIGLAS
ncbi:protein arginine N-methyltransferase 5-like [Galendromus occidentalis]|uniref:Protein arginine N-methyltransferase n=1 Tax=Galendromus occidentalis TaxID=34638 RepID=A0AAJ7WI46_9ACAR|nr:protein arginine N-methyltransferase 5-like [Galendromus occidentalis]